MPAAHDIPVVALIATYSPGAATCELVRTITTDGTPVLVSDDSSPVTSDPILRQLGEIEGVQVVRHHHNRGIARSLNVGLTYAVEVGATWLLTFDQDSQIDPDYIDPGYIGPGYIAEIVDFAESWTSLWGDDIRIGAVGAGQVMDNGGQLHYPITRITTERGEISCTEEVIQSGTLWSVAAMNAVGGFDESLGIDAVDAAACLRLREQGYRIALAPELVVHHQLGESRPVQILGKTVLATGHSGERRATMMRNRLRLAPAEFRQSPKHAFRTLRRVGVNAVLGVTVESDRWEKAKGSIRGLRGKGNG